MFHSTADQNRAARSSLASLVLAVGLALGLQASSTSAESGTLEMFTVTVDAAGIEPLIQAGYDVAAIRETAGGYAVDLVLWPHERARLAAEGRAPLLWRDPGGKSASVLAAQQADEGFKVWKSFDEAGGFLDEVYAIAKAYPRIVKLVVAGFSVQGRPIVALKVTKNANHTPDGTRPAVLYLSMQHAREWIGPELNRRLLRHFVEGYNGPDEAITELVDSHEIWFLLVANPDGYQYTFTPDNRLWRANLRDNNGDGRINSGDGVDLNRNFDRRWNWDNEGSSGSPGSGIYRGPEPASEPETRAAQWVMGQAEPAFVVNYHSFGPVLYYGPEWQNLTPIADMSIYHALSGTAEQPAVVGSPPETAGESAGAYITNGSTCDYAHEVAGALCWTPELSDGGSGGGFVFPDDEALIQKEFETHLPFALDLAHSAADPARPTSHLGNSVAPFQPHTFELSFGDPQPVEVTAARYLGEVTLRYRIGDGPEQSAPTREWEGGERYGATGDVFMRRLRGEIQGAAPGDRVTVWFTAEASGEAGAGGAEDEARSEPFTYTLASDSGARVLILGAEDYTGASPVHKSEVGVPAGPAYAQYYRDALAANGIVADLYDVDARGRRAPSPLGVLGHYDAVVWYTGDDIVTREVGMEPFSASRLAEDLQLAVRDYLNEGGKLLYTGKYAAFQYAAEQFQYDLVANAHCNVPGEPRKCNVLSNDFVQYYLGADDHRRTIATPIDADNHAGAGGGLWTGTGSNVRSTLVRSFDFSRATIPVTLAFDAYWNVYPLWDHGYVEVSTDGGQAWTSIPDIDGVLTDANPYGNNAGWSLTGFGRRRLRFDLSAHAAITRPLGVRLRYASGGSVTRPGVWIDNIVVEDAIGRLDIEDFEDGVGDWANAGWLTLPLPAPSAPAIFPVATAGGPFGGLFWAFGAPGATNQDHSASFLPTSRSHPPGDYPWSSSRGAAWFANPAQAPRTGSRHAYSQMGTSPYQRLTRTIDLAGQSQADLSFWVSHDLATARDAVFVESRTAGDDWTTLPDRNGHTSPATALACANAAWFAARPHLAHYMTRDTSGASPVCRPAGSTGVWQAASGHSGGWQQWSVDLSAYAGRPVEVSIAYVRASAASVGVMIDDLAISTGASTSFEDGLGGWAPGQPPSPAPPSPDAFFAATFADYPYSAAIATDDTLLFGFGIEGIARAEDRAAVMGRVMAYLLPRHRLFVPVTLRGEAWR